MKDITDVLDTETKLQWQNIEINLEKMKKLVDPELSNLSETMTQMLQDFKKSYVKHDQAPPGIKETLDVILPLSVCANKEQLTDALSKEKLQLDLVTATNKVESVKSGMSYVKGGLRVIAALVLFLVAVPAVFVSTIAGVALTGVAVSPILAGIIAPFVISIPTYLTIKGSTDLMLFGINQIDRTCQENTVAKKDTSISHHFGLFTNVIKPKIPEAPQAQPGPNPNRGNGA